MTLKELITYQIDDAGYQLEKVLEGFPEALVDYHVPEIAMSPREIVGHLCEAYQATITMVEGGTHEWGSYQAPTKDWGPLLAVFTDLRAKATAAILTLDEEKAAKDANAYIIAHDYYHVGQLANAKRVAVPEWDGYSIYRA